MASAARSMGMKVLVYDPFAGKEFVEKAGASYASSLDDIWRSSDFITLHVPKNKDTIHLINRDSIAKMKKGVKIINCARGAIANETDWLKRYRPARLKWPLLTFLRKNRLLIHRF